MPCYRVHIPGAGTAIVCSRGRRAKRSKQPDAPAPMLPLAGGGETERRRIERLLACVRREAAKRQRFYALWVADGRMLPETALTGQAEWEDVERFVAAALTGHTAAERHEMDRRIAIVAREIERRRRAYPNLIARGTLSVKTAERELLEMGEVLTWLQERRSCQA